MKFMITMKKELRSSDELLTAEVGSNSSQETGTPDSIKETCASTPCNPIGDSLFKKTVIPRSERKWITIDANPSPRSGLPANSIQDGHEDGFVITIKMNVMKTDIISFGKL